MSELTTAARPYARAAFEMAEKAGSLTEWSSTLGFMSAIASNDDVKELLSKPEMAKQAGATAFVELCDGKLNDGAKNLVEMLAENDRLSLIPEISVLFETLKDEAEGSVEALVSTAKELSDDEQNAISSALKKRLGRDVKLKISLDESLLGGAIIQAGDLVIDGSLKGRLDKMTTVMSV